MSPPMDGAVRARVAALEKKLKDSAAIDDLVDFGVTPFHTAGLIELIFIPSVSLRSTCVSSAYVQNRRYPGRVVTLIASVMLSRT